MRGSTCCVWDVAKVRLSSNPCLTVRHVCMKPCVCVRNARCVCVCVRVMRGFRGSCDYSRLLRCGSSGSVGPWEGPVFSVWERHSAPYRRIVATSLLSSLFLTNWILDSWATGTARHRPWRKTRISGFSCNWVGLSSGGEVGECEAGRWYWWGHRQKPGWQVAAGASPWTW